AQGTWAPPDEETLEAGVRRYLDPANPSSVYLGIVHRLDRQTSGVILWAKTEKAARRLSTQFQTRRALKEYWAVIAADAATSGVGLPPANRANEGEPADRLVWHDWLKRPDASGQASAVAPNTPGARQATTRLVVAPAIDLPSGCSWLRLWPETGRTHQLRVQA